MRNTKNKIMGNCNSTCNSNMLNNTICKILKLVKAKKKRKLFVKHKKEIFQYLKDTSFFKFSRPKCYIYWSF